MSAEETRSAAEERALLKAVGARLRLLRRLAGRTEERAAASAGVSVELLRLVESGQADLSLLTVRRIARALGVDFWLQTIDIAERKAAGKARPPALGQTKDEPGLHVHLHVTDDPCFAAVLLAELMRHSRTEEDT
jgi:transcriptional regulator with XRE-family HTH domain